MNRLLKEISNNFLATGVGSLPHLKGERAVDFIMGAFVGHAPFWPQLPKNAFFENMSVQFCEKLPGFIFNENKKTFFVDTRGDAYCRQMEECFNKCQDADANYFAISRAYASGLYLLSDKLMEAGWQGWVKAQIIGPFSLGLSVLDENKNPILYNADIAAILPLFLAQKLSWLIKKIKVHQNIKIIVVIDEPYLVAVGTSQCSLSRQEIIDMINRLVQVAHDHGALAGLHCCGNTDWDLAMSLEVDILNFDAHAYLDKLLLYGPALSSFLARGGVLAPGIVPNSQDRLRPGWVEETLEVFIKHRDLFANGALITTSCGLSGMSVEAAEAALAASVELAERLRAEF